MIPTNAAAADYEAAMQMKVMILTGLFYSRQEGGADAAANFFKFTKEFMSG